MGNWRTVAIRGHMDADEAQRLREDLAFDYAGQDTRIPIAECLAWAGGSSPQPLMGIGVWVMLDGCLRGNGNLFERDYTVEDVRNGLANIVARYPSFTAVVHCGGENEDPTCVASLIAVDGKVWASEPLVDTVSGVDVHVARDRLLRAIGGGITDMAYSNYGGRVTRNGIRMTTHEDRTPFREEDPDSGTFHQGNNPKHAILGSGQVRLCGYKTDPELWIDGQERDLEPYCQGPEDNAWRDGGGDVDGYRFAWTIASDRNLLTLALVEPDGTLWLGYSGYGTGAGWDDEE